MEPHDHLVPQAARLLSASLAARFAFLERDKVVPTTTFNMLQAHLETLFTGPRVNRPPALAVGGMSGIGKSMGVKDFLRKHKPRRDKASGILLVPVLYLEYPPVAGTHWYLKALFEGLGYKSIIPQHTSDAFALLLTRLALARTRLIICEEVHQICGSRPDVIREWYGITRWLMNQSKIPQVLVGTEEMFDLLDGDIQLIRRFDRLELAPWDNGPELAGFAKGYLRTVPLPEETVITSGLLDQIYETGQGIPDTTVKVLNRAAKKAMVAACSRILPEHIAADATLAAPVVTGRKAIPRYKRRPKSQD